MVMLKTTACLDLSDYRLLNIIKEAEKKAKEVIESPDKYGWAKGLTRKDLLSRYGYYHLLEEVKRRRELKREGNIYET